jgi:hypothetical protein
LRIASRTTRERLAGPGNRDALPFGLPGCGDRQATRQRFGPELSSRRRTQQESAAEVRCDGLPIGRPRFGTRQAFEQRVGRGFLPHDAHNKRAPPICGVAALSGSLPAHWGLQATKNNAQTRFLIPRLSNRPHQGLTHRPATLALGRCHTCVSGLLLMSSASTDASRGLPALQSLQTRERWQL